MNIKKVLRWFLVLIGVIVMCPLAPATVVDRLTFSELARRADRIVVGKVIDIRYEVIGGEAWTVVTALPELQYKGKDSTVTFRIPGGRQIVNGRILVTAVEGAPQFHILQKGVFFVGGQAPEYFQLLGWNRGFWPIEIRAGREMVLENTNEPDQTAPAIELGRFLQAVDRALEVK